MIRIWQKLVSVILYYWNDFEWKHKINLVFSDIDTRPIIIFDLKNKGVEKTRQIKTRTNNISPKKID